MNTIRTPRTRRREPRGTKQVGRPTMLDDATIRIICRLTTLGMSLSQIEWVIGAASGRLHSWLSRGRRESSGRYHELAAAVDLARGAARPVVLDLPDMGEE